MDVLLVGWIAGFIFGGWRTGFLKRLIGIGFMQGKGEIAAKARELAELKATAAAGGPGGRVTLTRPSKRSRSPLSWISKRSAESVPVGPEPLIGRSPITSPFRRSMRALSVSNR